MTATTTTGAAAGGNRRIELPKNVIPSHYNLTMYPNMTDFTFIGHVDITVRVVEETSTIVLNTLDVAITKATVTARGHTYTSAPATYDATEQTATLAFDATLGAGLEDVHLAIDFTGTINDQMAGFYRSSYDENGTTKFMAVTQFEATDARRALPCFDEPKLKATFDVTLVVDAHLTALSNCDVVSDEPVEDGAKRKVTFATTPIMSTYLLAFAIGEFEWIESYTRPTEHLPNRVRVRTYTTKGLINQGRFALAVAVKTLEYFSEVFGVPYPLTKLDQIACHDFSAGAMENWGLVTYRNVALLVDENSSASAKKWVATTVTHELAHQWFGNLVTFTEWDELWLNEGFATWVGTYGAGHLFPEWDIWTQFLSDDQSYALVVDGLRSSHPIQVEVLDPAEIGEIFDAVSYSKGASVIHMLTNWLGIDVFFKGIRAYVKKFAYKNATTNDLWAALSEASGLDVGAFMGVWTSKVGYPVLNVEEQALPSGADGVRLHLTQRRYLRTGDVAEADDTTVWSLPLNVAAIPAGAAAGKAPRVISHEVMQSKSLDLDLVLPAGTKASPVFLLNQDRAGLYRVAYSAAQLKRITKAINAGTVPTRDRLGLMDDAFSLAASGDAPTAQFLSLVANVIPAEREYVVLADAAASINKIRFLLSGESQAVQDRVELLRRTIFAPHAHRLGFEAAAGESPLIKLLRPIMINIAGHAGDEKTIAECRARFAWFSAGETDAILSDINNAVLSTVVAYGGEAEWEAMLNLYKTTSEIDRKYAALQALGATKVPALIQRTLDLALDTEIVRPQDIHHVFGPLGGNAKARKALWNFLKAKWEVLASRYGSQFSMLGQSVAQATQVTTTAELDNIKAFFADKDTKIFDRKLAEVYDRANATIAWLARDRDGIVEWFEDWELQAKYGY
ncbi:hypothetical protein H9P43_002742 [Blastocladiella emersonii ATCC 22665]|nr:hypothetical protein H9P43_002742 [Blastocladiella emersonii ATCC 22665]